MSNFKVAKFWSAFCTEINFLANIGEKQNLNNTGTQCQTLKLQNFDPLFVLNCTYTKSSLSPLRSNEYVLTCPSLPFHMRNYEKSLLKRVIYEKYWLILIWDTYPYGHQQFW
jgi:hypothetical protein